MTQMVQPAVIKVLLVEDDPEDVLLVRDMFWWEDADRFNLIRVATLEEATQRLKGEPFDVILLDLSLPDSMGLGGLSAAREVAPELPIVVLSHHSEEGMALAAMDAGAQDYLVKTPGNTISLSRIRRAMERTRKSGQHIERPQQDAVTGLMNRQHFRDLLADTMGRASTAPFSLMLLDLDRFKAINDSLGHLAGDHLLAAVGERLSARTGAHDQVARLGDDEFALLLTEAGTREAAEAAANDMLNALSEPFKVDRHEFYTTASIGIACSADGHADAAELFKAAESALSQAKQHGHNSYQFYSPELLAPAVEKLKLETAMRQALERDEFVLYYQPQIDLATGTIAGIEALLRWHHPKFGLMMPGQFIWLAEETGLIVPIGDWVLKTACKQAKQWRDIGLPAMRMVVNLSAQQFKQDALVTTIRDALTDSDLPPSILTVEITEAALMEHPGTDILRDIKQMGVSISIDDFGTGYSNLGYLKRIPADVLKLDRCFVSGVAHDTGDAAIARAVIGLAQGLNLTVIAEGVETREQYDFLKEEGCHGIQGFLLGRPLPSRRFEAFARKGVTLPA